jgi:hypothetical protein
MTVPSVDTSQTGTPPTHSQQKSPITVESYNKPMSFNLHLQATRTLTLPSGKTEVQTERPDIFYQTPTAITNSILALPSFDARLEAYLEWAKSTDYQGEDEDKIIYTDGSSDGYTKTSFLEMLEDGVLIERVHWKGEKEFDEYVEKEWKDYTEYVETFEGVFWISDYENHRKEILQKIQELKDREFELELYYI